MPTDESHLTDQELLLAADGELSIAAAAHLSTCASCRSRKQELDQAMESVAQMHRVELDAELPSAIGPRALLKARLAEKSAQPRLRWSIWPGFFVWKRAGLALVFATAFAIAYRYGAREVSLRPRVRNVPVSFPEPSLTPGAVVSASREQVCRADNQNNRAVAAVLRRRVFEEYGIPNADPRAYEVDYLITPALGGADDIRNLWPQSTSSAMWNARVKDALEDRLRDLVCEGSVDLSSAQREIASDWIAAYKKYFGTDRPLESNR